MEDKLIITPTEFGDGYEAHGGKAIDAAVEIKKCESRPPDKSQKQKFKLVQNLLHASWKWLARILLWLFWH